MKIAYFINSMEGGGAQSPLPRIVSALEKAGAQVRVFALSRRNGLAIPRLQERGVEPMVREGGEKDHLAAFGWMTRQADAWKADAIWTSLTRATLLGQFVGQRMGLPIVSWQHNAFLKPWNERLLRARAVASDIWVADSAQVAELTVERLGVARKDLVSWPIFSADPNAPQAKAWKQGEILRLGSLGRLHPAKGYDFLIEALALLKQRNFAPVVPFEVHIGGIGKDKALLEEQAQNAGVTNLYFDGFVENPDKFLASLHLYLQPSRREGFCIAAHEAMQAGLPVIVSQTGEMPFTVNNDRLGKAVPVGNVSALADALADYLTRPKDLAAIGLAARNRVRERFSEEAFDAVGAEIIARLREIVAERQF